MSTGLFHAGAIAGIVIAVLVSLIIIIVLMVLLVYVARRKVSPKYNRLDLPWSWISHKKKDEKVSLENLVFVGLLLHIGRSR